MAIILRGRLRLRQSQKYIRKYLSLSCSGRKLIRSSFSFRLILILLRQEAHQAFLFLSQSFTYPLTHPPVWKGKLFCSLFQEVKVTCNILAYLALVEICRYRRRFKMED